MTEIMKAVMNNNLTKLEEILTKNNNNIDCMHGGITPLDFALFNNYSSIVECLVNMGGADISLKDNTGLSPLCWAILFADTINISFILYNKKVDMYCINNQEQTIWDIYRQYCITTNNTPEQMADKLSVMLCFGLYMIKPQEFIKTIPINDKFSSLHYDFLERTVHAHIHPDIELFRARKLELLHESDYNIFEKEVENSECTLYRDVRNIMLAYLKAPINLLPLMNHEMLLADATISLVKKYNKI